MHCIAVLTDKESGGRRLAGWVRQAGAEYGMFPQVESYEDAERFFYAVQRMEPEGVIIDLSGVAGLNAAEHLRALRPDCGLIWCCDLDFSLQAYRLRAEYFILGPVCEAELKNGLILWFEGRGYRAKNGREGREYL